MQNNQNSALTPNPAPQGSNFFERVVEHDAARKGLAAAVAGIVVAAVSEMIWPSE